MTVTPNTSASGDSLALEHLFDTIAQQSASQAVAHAEPVSSEEKVFKQLGQMTRELHDTMQALGYDKVIGEALSSLPDACDRLGYIANLTEQAACRVLNATDVAMPLQERVAATVGRLGKRWDAVFTGRVGPEQFKSLADETRFFLKEGLISDSKSTDAQLMEIIMAQEFQDLTGQVIKKVIATLYRLETQLMGLLVELAPDERRSDEAAQFLAAAPVPASIGADVVDASADTAVDQGQVDDLLASLGF